MGDAMAGGCFGQSNHKMIKFTFEKARRVVNKAATFVFQRAEVGLLRDLVDREKKSL